MLEGQAANGTVVVATATCTVPAAVWYHKAIHHFSSLSASSGGLPTGGLVCTYTQKPKCEQIEVQSLSYNMYVCMHHLSPTPHEATSMCAYSYIYGLVSHSQTAFARREKVWYNAYAWLVQNPPELGDQAEQGALFCRSPSPASCHCITQEEVKWSKLHC